MPRFLPFVVLILAAASATAPAGIAIVGGLTEERVVEPGKSYTGTIRIRNLGSTPEAARLYLTDYAFQADGTNQYGQPGKAPRSNARWITLGQTLLTIPPKAEASFTYRIDVPADAKNLAGTYWSMLMVEGLGEVTPQDVAASPAKVRIGIRQVLRYGIQMVTDIGETGTRSLQFEPRLLRAEGRRLLQIDVANNGERWLRPVVSVQLFDAEGRLVRRLDGERARVYPGTSVRRAIDLTDVPAGDYKALLVADAGDESVYGATYALLLER